MKKRNSISFKSIYSVMMLLLVAFIVIKGSTITSLAGGDGKTTPYTTMEDTVRAVRAGLMARQSHIEVRTVVPQEYRSNLSQFLDDVYNATLVHDPSTPNGGDYLESNRGACHMGASGSVENLTLTFDTPACGEEHGYLSTPEQETETLTTLDAAVASLNLSSYSTDYDKVKAIYDYVRLNVTYDKSLTDHSTYSAAVKRKSVCQGYSSMLYYMMLKAGIDCRIITGQGNGGAHAWNIVKISDPTLGTYWYNVDVTWDSDNGSDTYFLLSDATFSSSDYGTHTRNDDYKTDAFYQKYPMTTVDNPFKDDGQVSASLLGCVVEPKDMINVVCYFDASTWSASQDYNVVFDIPSTPGYTQELTYAQKTGTGSVGDKPAVVYTYKVPARCMSEVLTAQVVSTDGTKKSEVFRVSVKKYLDVLLEKPGTNEGLKEFYRAMLFYGAYAQKYFNMNPSVPADKGIEADDPIKNMDNSEAIGYIENGKQTSYVNIGKMSYDYFKKTPAPSVSSDSNIAYSGSCLVLRSQTVIRHYFKLSGDAQMSDYTFISGTGTTLTPFEKGGYVCVEIAFSPRTVKYVAPTSLADITVKKSSTDVIKFSYNPMDYAYKALSDSTYNTDEKFTNLMKSYMWYCITSHIYSGN